MTAVVVPCDVVTEPTRHPGFCAKCLVGSGATERKFFVHTGMEYDYEGVVYLCNMCLEDICRQTGAFYTQDMVDDIIRSFKHIAEKGEADMAKYNRAVGILGAVGIDFDDFIERLDVNGIFGGIIGQAAESDSNAGTGSEPVVGTQPAVTQSASEYDSIKRESDVLSSEPNPLLLGYKFDL